MDLSKLNGMGAPRGFMGGKDEESLNSKNSKKSKFESSIEKN